MIRVCVLIYSIVLLGETSYAQIPNMFNPWNTPLTYNHAACGVYNNESVSMGLFSLSRPAPLRSSVAGPGFPTVPTIRNIRLNDIYESTFQTYALKEDARNLYFINYHRNFEFKNKNKLTFGLQFEKLEKGNTQFQNPTSFGITTNFHKLLRSDATKERYLSIGLQLNLVPRSPNKAIAIYAYNELLNSDTNISFEDFIDRFKHVGDEQGFSINYSYKKLNSFHINTGFTASRVQYRIINNRNNPNQGLQSFSTKQVNTVSLNFEFQVHLGDKVIFFTNALLSLGAESELLGGLGFRIRNRNILKVGYGFSPDNEIFYTTASYETLQYKFMLSGNPFKNTLTDSKFIQLAVRYSIQARDSNSLISNN